MSGLRTSIYYSLETKLEVIERVMKGELSKERASRIYGIKGHSTISKWIDKLGYKFKVMDPDKEKEYKSRVKELECLLEYERLKREAAERMILIAEQDYKISIRKKSVTKQLNK